MRAGALSGLGELDGLAARPPRRRRGGHGSRRRRSRKARALLLGIWTLAGLVGVLVGLRASEPLAAHFRPELLRVDRVEIVGAEHAPAAELVALLGVAAGTPVLSLDTPELERRVASHPWVAHARVALLRPGRILVAVEERRPVAVAVLGAPPTSFWLDAEGVPFLPVGAAGTGDRMLVVGAPDARPGRPDERFAEGVTLADAVARQGVAGVREIHVAGADPAELPVLVLEGGTRVTLGAGEPEARLRRLAALQRARLPEVAAAREIDLRFGDRMVLRGGPPSGGEAGVAGASGRSTPPNGGSRG